jgi:pimeloyl-ACP methyl ester carboxylesterase
MTTARAVALCFAIACLSCLHLRMFEASLRLGRDADADADVLCGDVYGPACATRDSSDESPSGSLPASSSGAGPAYEGDLVPAVLFVPDILLSRRHGFYPYLCRQMARERLALCVDSARSGYGEVADENGSAGGDAGAARGMPAFDADRASGYLLSRELQDLVRVVRSLARGELPGAETWDQRHLTVVGHGKGAALALHLSRRLPMEGLPVTGVVLMSPPSTLVREGSVEGDPAIHVPVDPGAVDRKIHGEELVHDIVLGSEFLADARQLSELASLSELMSSCEPPVLMLVGEEDPVFDVEEAERLLRVGHSDKDVLNVVEMAGHHFGAAHPFEGPTPPLDYVVDQCLRFFRSIERSAPGEGNERSVSGG